MNRARIAATGGLTLAAAGIVAAALLIPGTAPTEPTPLHRPAGQVEEVIDTPTTTSTSATTLPVAEVPEPAPVDNDPMDTPVETGGEQPAPGVPYDSDGGPVYPNPPDMAPGEVAPSPPAEPAGPPAPPVEQPVIPGEVINPAPLVP